MGADRGNRGHPRAHGRRPAPRRERAAGGTGLAADPLAAGPADPRLRQPGTRRGERRGRRYRTHRRGDQGDHAGGPEPMITAETVNGIVRFQANGLPVVSLYCRVDPGASQREVCARVDSLLDQIRPLAKDRDLDHRYRLSVRTDIERIKDALGSERWPPGTVAVFSCSGRGLYEEIPLPRRVREQVMVYATPLARPMLAVLGEYSRACVLVINREAAPVWEMYQDEMREVETITDPLRKAGNTGGSCAEDRIQNRVDEQSKRHFRRVAQVIDQLLRTDGYD